MEFRRTFISIAIAIALVPSSASAKNEVTKLKQINQQITSVKTNIAQAEKKQAKVTTELQQAETEIGKIETNLNQTSQNLTTQKKKLDLLTKDQTAYFQQIKQEENHLLTQIRLAYMLGNEDYLKILLNQEDPNKISRMLIYHRYLLNSRLQLIDQTSATLSRIKQNKKKINSTALTLQELKTTQQKQHNELIWEKQNRTKILATVTTKIRTQNEQLKTLIANKENLEKLISKLAAAEETTKTPELPKTQISGKNVWPTRGKIAQHFGSSIQGSNWKWNGILIAAPEGQSVQATASGKVVFADWLSGYGLLLIISHGHGYMSLYGRNHSVYKNVGQTVTAGETVASVGKSGGFEKPYLYFAIRYNGKPVDPEKWYRKI